MYLKPCRNCPHTNDGCEIKTAKLEALRGLGVTSVNFKCDKRLSALRPGQRVEFHLDSEIRDLWCSGIVMRPHRNKLLVWVDEDSESNRCPILLHPNSLTPLDKPLVPLCPDCDQPEGTKPYPRDKQGGCDTFFCPRCAGWTYKGKNEWGSDEWVEPPADAALTGDRA